MGALQEKTKSYLMLEKRIRTHWHTDGFVASKTAYADFDIDGAGRLRNIRLTKPTRDAAFNEACLNALRNTSALSMKSWPYYEPLLDCKFVFTFNDHKESGNYIAAPESGIRNGMSAINARINKNLADFVALDTDTTKLSMAAARCLVNACDEYININDYDQAKNLLRTLTGHPGISNADNEVKVLLQAESACVVLKQQNFAEASAVFKASVESPDFEKIGLDDRQHILKSYGDSLFKQGKEAEAKAIYAKLTILK